jgi:GT2 family glycosyltransferase
MAHLGRISVIILMHNNVSMTGRCLQSLALAVAGLDHEVILLDNGSSQDACLLNEFGDAFRRFKLIRSDENLSFSIGNNHCVNQASGQWLLFLNNDVFLGQDSIDHLIKPMIEDAETAATGGKLLFPGERYVQHAGISQMLWDHPSNFGVGARPDDGRILEQRASFALSGAMLCVDRSSFELINGFDERYIWGTEDIDLCLKIRAAGRNTIYCPEAVAVHHESATLKGSNRCESECNCRLYRKVWDPVLIPVEQKYVAWLKNQKIRRVAVFGMGTAARGLAKILDSCGIEIIVFTSSDTKATNEFFLNRPALPLADLKTMTYDRLLVATQYYFAVEPMIREFDPLHEPIYPSLN